MASHKSSYGTKTHIVTKDKRYYKKFGGKTFLRTACGQWQPENHIADCVGQSTCKRCLLIERKK